MKRLLVLGVVLVAAGTAAAQVPAVVRPMIGQGVRQLNVSGSMDDNGDDLGLSLSGRGGYFVMDGIEVGGGLGFSTRGDMKTISVLGFGEYNFDMGSPLVPYAGASLGFAWSDTGSDSDSYVELTGWGGARFFFVDYAALGAELALKCASQDRYNQYEDSLDWVLRLNTSWYF